MSTYAARIAALRENMTSHATRGMTLIEIMVVIAIIGILATALGFGAVQWMDKARVDACKAQIRTMANGVDLYAVENDYPSDLRDVAEAKYIKEKQLKDPWQQEFVFSYPSSRDDHQYDLCSNGPDRVQGSDDDICND